MLLEAWRKFEQQAQASGEEQKVSAVAAVQKRMPKRIKRKRPIETDDGSNAGMEVTLPLPFSVPWSEGFERCKMQTRCCHPSGRLLQGA